MMLLVDQGNHEILLPNVEVARSVWERFRGLMFRRSFAEGFGLWLEPCHSVHTMWMRVPVDVYFIDQTGLIIEHRANITPWSIVMPKERCHSVLEIPLATTTLPVGMRICLRSISH